MKDNVKFEFVDDHIRVTLADGYEFDPAASGGLWDELARLCRENGTRRVLVEGRAPEIEPEIADIIASGQSTAAVPNLWMAFHLDEFEPTPNSELFEAIAGTMGVRVKHFTDRGHAIMWLRNNAPK